MSSEKELLLWGLRCAVYRAKLDANSFELVGCALASGNITPEIALEWLADLGIDSQLDPPRSPAEVAA